MPVSLKERLMSDLKAAMRARDVLRLEAIRMARAGIQNAEIEWQREATDSDVEQIIAREVRRREEALALYRKAGRDDLITEEEAGIAVLQEYLPQQMTEDQIRPVVKRIVSELGASDLKQLGPVMRQAMAELKGKADGRQVNEIVRKMLTR